MSIKNTIPSLVQAAPSISLAKPAIPLASAETIPYILRINPLTSPLSPISPSQSLHSSASNPGSASSQPDKAESAKNKVISIVATPALNPLTIDPPASVVERSPLIKETALTIINEMSNINIKEANEAVIQERGVSHLDGAFANPNSTIDFGVKGYKLLGITIDENCHITGTHGLLKYTRAKAVFENNPEASFEMAYDPLTQDCCIERSYRGDLPTWIRFGDPRHWLDPVKGIPTAKVIQGLMMKKLGMHKNNVKTFKLSCVNAQTFVDAIHGIVIQGKPITRAFAASQTAQLTAELSQILGQQSLRLVSIKAAVENGKSNIEHYLNNSNWSNIEKAKFRDQPKLADLKKIGIDLCEMDEYMMPTCEIPGMTDLIFQAIP